MARSKIREDQVLDSDFLSEAELATASGSLQVQITSNTQHVTSSGTEHSSVVANTSAISQLNTDLATTSGILNDKLNKNIIYVTDQTIDGGAGTVGKVYYLTSTNDTWLESDKTIETTISGRLGVCSENNTIVYSGLATITSHGFGSTGLPLYVGVSGSITAIQPAEDGDFMKQLGYIEDQNLINVQIDENYYELGVINDYPSLGLASQEEAELGTSNSVVMSALSTKQANKYYGHRNGGDFR